MPLLFLKSKTLNNPEADILNQIDKHIAQIKKNGKYKEETLIVSHAELTEETGPWQNTDARYPAKLNVLNALSDYICSNRNSEDWENLNKVIHNPENKDFDKGGIIGHSTTQELVWKVRDNFPPSASHSKKFI